MSSVRSSRRYPPRQGAEKAANISGSFFVRVDKASGLPGVGLIGSAPAAVACVAFDGIERVSSSVKSRNPVWEDADFAFPVAHYYGQAQLTVTIQQAGGLLSKATPIGSVKLLAGDVVGAQQSALTSLCAPGAAATSAAAAAPAAGSSPPLDPRWLQHGSDPLAYHRELELRDGSKVVGTVSLTCSFVGGSLNAPLGPLRMNPAHRACAGGHADLLRLLAVSHRSQLTGWCEQQAAGMYPADFAARGTGQGHVRCLVVLGLLGTGGQLKVSRRDLQDMSASGITSAFTSVALQQCADTGRVGGAATTMWRATASSVQSALRISTSNLDGSTNLLHRAAESGYLPLLVLATSSTRTLTSPNEEGFTPFAIAAAHGHTTTLRSMFWELVAKVSSGESQDTQQHTMLTRASNSGVTPLMLAAGAGHVETVQALLAMADKGAQSSTLQAVLRAVDHKGRPALMYAAGGLHDSRSCRIVKVLQAASSGPEPQPAGGSSALLMACLAGNVDTATALLQGTQVAHDAVLATDALDRSPFAVAYVGAQQEKARAREGGGSPSAMPYTRLLSVLKRALTVDQACTAEHHAQDVYKNVQLQLYGLQEGGAAGDVPAAPDAPPLTTGNSLSRALSCTVIVLEDAAAAGAETGAPGQGEGGSAEGAPLPGSAVPLPGAAMKEEAQHARGGAAEHKQTVLPDTEEEAYGYDDEYEYDEEGEEDGEGGGGTEGGGDDLDLPPPPSMHTLVRQTSASVKAVRQEHVFQEQAAAIRQLAGAVKLPITTAGVLLRHHKFDPDVAFAAYSADPDAALREAGTSKPTADHALDSWLAGDAAEEPEEECEACLDDVPKSRLTHAGCGHLICLPCWKTYLKEAVSRSGPDVATSCHCPCGGCTHRIDELMWKTLADEATYRRYEQFLIRSFIKLSDDYVWCPRDGCDRAIKYSGDRSDLLCPTCGWFFCKLCANPAHAPATCQEAEQWREDKDSLHDVATRRLLMKNYKQCPKCGMYLQRSGGCNHMTCSQCKHQWCYMCKGDWSKHGSQTGGHFKCNIYEKAKKERPELYMWEGYSEDELKVLKSKANTERERLFNDTQPKVAAHEEGAVMCHDRLQEFRDEQQALELLDSITFASDVTDVHLDELVQQVTPMPKVHSYGTSLSEDEVNATRAVCACASGDSINVFEFNGEGISRPGGKGNVFRCTKSTGGPFNVSLQVPLSSKLPYFRVTVKQFARLQAGAQLIAGLGSKSMHVKNERVGFVEESLGWAAVSGDLHYGSSTPLRVPAYPTGGSATSWDARNSEVGIGLLHDKSQSPPLPRGVVFVLNGTVVARVPIRSAGCSLHLYPTLTLACDAAQVRVDVERCLPSFVNASVQDMLPNIARILATRARRALNLSRAAQEDREAKESAAAAAGAAAWHRDVGLLPSQQLADVTAASLEGGLGIAALEGQVWGRTAATPSLAAVGLHDSSPSPMPSPITAPSPHAGLDALDAGESTPGAWAASLLKRASSRRWAGAAAPGAPTHTAASSGAGDAAPSARLGMTKEDLQDVYLGGGDEAVHFKARAREVAMAAVSDALSALTEFHHLEKWVAVHMMYMGSTSMLSTAQRQQLQRALTAATAAAAFKDDQVGEHLAGALAGPATQVRVEQYKEMLDFKLSALARYADSLFELTNPARGLMNLDVAELRLKVDGLRANIAALQQEIDLENALLGGSAVIAQIRGKGGRK